MVRHRDRPDRDEHRNGKRKRWDRQNNRCGQFAWFLAYAGQRVQYLDCDVEEPNGHIFIKPSIRASSASKVMIPVVDQEKCTPAGNAGKMPVSRHRQPSRGHAHFSGSVPQLRSVQRCLPHGGHHRRNPDVGIIEQGRGVREIEFIHGILNVGEAMAVPLIKKVKMSGRTIHKYR